ncbi:hypothetical protein [Aminobacter anthyllidis]|uniref:hypothetical protein n=1 Tax=Aminobacter anthyllidis TaxID=1035067 RepID=UPI003CC805CE
MRQRLPAALVRRHDLGKAAPSVPDFRKHDTMVGVKLLQTGLVIDQQMLRLDHGDVIETNPSRHRGKIGGFRHLS